MNVVAEYLRRTAAVEKFYSDTDLTWQGEPDSIARTERGYAGPSTSASPWDPRIISSAYAAARVGTIAVAEQAIVIARIISDPGLGPYGLLGTDVCSRSAAEIAARTWHLMDPRINAHTRVARHLLDVLYSTHQADVLCSKMGLEITAIQSKSKSEMEDRCRELGFTLAGGSRGEYEIDGQRRPNSTDLVTDLVGATRYAQDKHMVYRLTSATTHGTVYALMRSFQQTDEVFDGEEVLDRIADHRVIEGAAGITLAVFIALFERIITLTGWPWYRAESFKNMTYAMLGDSPR